MRIFLPVLLLFVTSLVSCGPTTLAGHNKSEMEKARQHWVGKSESTLILSWGPPNSKSSDGGGGKIYTYRRGNGFSTWVTNFYIRSYGDIYNLNAHSESIHF